MLKYRNGYSLLGALLCMQLFTACVGTIEDKAKIDRSTVKTPSPFIFEGVEECYSVSDKRVEIVFPQAAPLGRADASRFVYKVFANGDFDNSVVASLQQDLRTDSRGRFHLEVGNLNLNTSYTFIVRAEDPVTGVQDKNTKACTVRTKSTKLPVFDGIQQVTSFPGAEGQSSLLIKWNTALAAEYLLGGIPANGFRIDKYNVYISTTSDNPDQMGLLTTLTEDRFNPVTQFQASGLLQGQNYNFLVRAVDELGREENNRIVFTARTSTPQSVFFAGATSVVTPANSAGYTSLRVHWNDPQGDYNLFRVFAIAEDNPLFNSSSIDPNDPTFMKAEITNTMQRQTTVPGLDPEKEHAIFVVACMSDEGVCITSAGQDVRRSGFTQPPLAPYAGIASVTALQGALGLNNARVSWSLPALSAGVCDGIRLYQEDEIVRECGSPGLDANEPCLANDTISCNAAEVNIGNLTPGVRYCFNSRVYEAGREQENNIVERCITTRFDPPVFQDPPTCTPLDGGTRVRIEWQAPNPVGLYNNFVVFSKMDNGVPVPPGTWHTQAKQMFEGLLDQSATPVMERYQAFLRPQGTFSYTVSGLATGTDYQFAVKTQMEQGGQYYFDEGTTVITCRTRQISLNFGGWEHVLSVGPRINGLASHRTASSTEPLMSNLTGTGSLNEVTFRPRGIEPESLIVSNGITMPKVIRAGAAISEIPVSDNGLVQLMWKEFKTSDGIPLSEYLFEQGVIQNPATDGYYLYRRVTPLASTQLQYESLLNQIEGANIDWEVLNPGSPMTLGPDGIGRFEDHLPNLFHPVNEVGGSASFRDKANTGKVVWYTVRYRLQGKLAPINSNVNKDAIIAVIVPPANMASIHHWVANKRICEFYNKEVDRNKDYRCSYGGLSSKELDGNFFFDIKGHTLVDRWTLGCNFTRFDDGDKFCRNKNSEYDHLNHNSTGVNFGTSNSVTLDSELRDKHGDCIGAQSDKVNFPNAPRGSVYYNSHFNSCYYRVGELLTLDEIADFGSDQSANWATFGDASFEVSRPRANETRMPAALSDEFLGRVYPQNTQPEMGEGVGQIISSNDSSLPPITRVTQEQGHYLCQSHPVKIRSGNVSSPPIRKRLVSSQEQILSVLPHPNTTEANRIAVEQALNRPPRSSSGGFKTMGSRTLTGGQCATYSDTVSHTCSSCWGEYPYDHYQVTKLTKVVNQGNYNRPAIFVTGSYDVSGVPFQTAALESGDYYHNGTERCVSGFGVQDYVGTIDYWLSEQMLCQVNSGGTDVSSCDISPSNIRINAYEATGETWPRTRYSSSNKTFYGQDDFKNALGSSFSMSSLFIDQDFETSFGVPIAAKDRYENYLMDPVTLFPVDGASSSYLASTMYYPYSLFPFSFTTGVSVNCASGFCHPDDNRLFADMSFPNNMTNYKDRFFEVEFTPNPLTADSFFVKSRKRSIAKTNTGRLTSGVGLPSFQFILDGLNEIIGVQRLFHSFGMDWRSQAGATNLMTGVRCAVKVNIDLAGNIIAADNVEQ